MHTLQSGSLCRTPRPALSEQLSLSPLFVAARAERSQAVVGATLNCQDEHVSIAEADVRDPGALYDSGEALGTCKARRSQ